MANVHKPTPSASRSKPESKRFIEAAREDEADETAKGGGWRFQVRGKAT